MNNFYANDRPIRALLHTEIKSHEIDTFLRIIIASIFLIQLSLFPVFKLSSISRRSTDKKERKRV